MKITLVGHTISPFRGSEPGNTWNWAWHLSQHVEIEVFAHPHYRKEVEAFLAENPNPRLRVTWVELQGKDPWDQTSERGLRLHYWLWLSEVRGRLRHALEGKKGALIHHVSWGTVSAPPPFTGLGVPVVWGPVGGGQTSPLSFLWFCGREAPGELLRSLRVKALPLLPSWRARVRGYARVFATNRETARLLELVRSDVQLWLDTGIPLGFGSEPTARRPGEEGEFTLLWAGRLEPIKGFPLALEALRHTSFPVRLVVAGQGPMLSRYRKMVAKLGLAERVQFLGRVPHERMGVLFRQADAFLFTSIRDSFGAVVLEAMAFGVPVVVPDHQGVGTFVPESAGIKVPVTTYRQTARAYAQAIDLLAQNPELRLRLAQGAWRYAQQERWDRRVERMLGVYEEVLSDAHRPF